MQGNVRMEPIPETVGQIMSRDVLTLSEDQDLAHLETTMRLFRFRHLPVTDEGKLVGVVTQRDLLRIAGSSLLPHAGEQTQALQRRFRVRDVITRDVRTVRPDTPLAEAARIMNAEKLGCVPVVDGANVLRGIVTEADFVLLALRLLQRPHDHERADVLPTN
jgi:CBS domain-containing membrane protein